MTSELERTGCLAGASALWSLWPGYLERVVPIYTQAPERYRAVFPDACIRLRAERRVVASVMPTLPWRT